MADDPLFLVTAGACLLVLIILITGVGAFGRGGTFNKKYANKLMRLRILAQGIAVALILIFVGVRSGG